MGRFPQDLIMAKVATDISWSKENIYLVKLYASKNWRIYATLDPNH